MPPEVLHQIAFSRWFSFSDLLNLICASEALFEKLTGDEYALTYLRSCTGLAWCIRRGCIQKGWEKAAKIALKWEIPTQNDLLWALRNAKIVKILLADPRVDPTAKNNEAFRWAARNGQTETVKLLLADPRVISSTNDNWAVKGAAQHGHAETLKVLLADPRIDPIANDDEAIRWAAFCCYTETVKILMADPRINPSGLSVSEMESITGQSVY